MTAYRNASFYERGIQFECTRCGKCCTGFPGFVYLSQPDMKSISDYLNMDKGVFAKKYVREVHVFHEKRFSLIEKRNYDCIFWDKICTIYPVRPHQCRTYPFWKRHLVSLREWNKIEGFCPGINRGKVYSREEILSLSESTPNYNVEKFDPGFLKELE